MKNRKERKYYEDPNDNAAFLRCVDLLAGLIEKYADVVLEKSAIGIRSIMNTKKQFECHD